MSITISITQSDSSYSPSNGTHWSWQPDMDTSDVRHKRAAQSDSDSSPTNGSSSNDSDLLHKLIEQLLALLNDPSGQYADGGSKDGDTDCRHGCDKPSMNDDGNDSRNDYPDHRHAATESESTRHSDAPSVTSGGTGTITHPVASGGTGTITNPVASGGTGTTTEPAAPAFSNSPFTNSGFPFANSGDNGFYTDQSKQHSGNDFYQ